MKKFLYALLVGVLLVGLIACTPAAEPGVPEEPSVETPEEPVVDAEKTLLNFAVQADSTPALDKLVEAFNEQSEMYEVKATIMTNDSGQMHDQLLNSLSSKLPN